MYFIPQGGKIKILDKFYSILICSALMFSIFSFIRRTRSLISIQDDTII